AVALPRSHYGEGNGSIFLDDLSCTGHEKNWWECTSYTANHNCRHIEDASVRCQPKVCDHGAVRLADGTNELEGRLEVCIDGAWGTVCHDFWTGIDAQVVCRQLGYLGT
uniref:SRCR domain-containing protein n=1 Tax=Amphimedon queenslandica TaxID=400682 RepID=A0A1X7SNY3_AMPQE